MVNTKGDLIGINTAISSQTGAFVGYSFAVPSNIAKKVVQDLMEFGNVQKAMLGVIGGELDSKVAQNLDIKNTEGFYVSDVSENSGAQKAGLKGKDIIIQLDGVKISTYADLTGFLRTKRPNDKISVKYIRNGEERNVQVTLTKNEVSKVSTLGLELKNIDKSELNKMKLENGVKVSDITNKELLNYGVKKGFVIISINGEKVYTVDDVQDKIEAKNTYLLS